MTPFGTPLSASAVIVAAGGARRMGFDKLTAELAGESVLVRSVRAFEECPEIAEIVVVTSAERGELLEGRGFTKISAIIPGGAERHLSVWEGLQHCLGTVIAVHDAARPLVSPELISQTLRMAAGKGAAAAAHRITETVKRADEAGQVAESIDRTNLWAMETPQCFRTEVIIGAYRALLENEESVTDEVSAAQRFGHAVQLVENLAPNIKITFPADLALAERLLTAAR